MGCISVKRGEEKKEGMAREYKEGRRREGK
jgi:hypothetical protein